MENLKQKLLSLGTFNDNQYLDFYCDLIERNRKTLKEKSVTQCHHIIPKCLKGGNSKENLVNLKYSDHILAHYYLCLCINDKSIKYKLENAFLHLTYRKWKLEDFEPEKLEYFDDIYKEWCKENSEIHTGKSSWNKGKKGTYRLPQHTEEQLKKMSISQIGSKNHMYGKCGKNHHSSKPVLQFDLQGNFIREYENAREVFRLNNYLPSCITLCCNQKFKVSYNYIWIFKKDFSEEILKKRVEKAKSFYMSNLKICQYDKNGTFIKEWNNSAEIMHSLKLKASTDILRCCRGQRKSFHGYIWRYK